MDVVESTAKRCNTTVEAIFRQATLDMGFTNHIEVFNFRYNAWKKRGEIPPYVQSYCTGTSESRKVRVQ